MKKFLVLAAVCGVLFLCVSTGMYNVLFSTIFNRPTTGQEVSMLQPNGIFLDRDQQASEINVNNSEANKNNGEYIESKAVATLTVAQADSTKDAYTSNGLFLGGIGGILIGGILVFGFIVLVFFVAMAFAARSQGSGTDIQKR